MHTATWRIESATGKKEGDVVRVNDPVFLHNEFTGLDTGFLDTNDAGCQGNYLCASTTLKPDRANAQTGTWIVESVSDKDAGDTLHIGDPIRLRNAYLNGNGGYLDTRGVSCEGNLLCVSTSQTPRPPQRQHQVAIPALEIFRSTKR
jgi:hypothetical protein